MLDLISELFGIIDQVGSLGEFVSGNAGWSYGAVSHQSSVEQAPQKVILGRDRRVVRFALWL
jgi:hypothetical protein